MKSIQSVLGSFLLVLLTLCNLPSVHANPAEATKATLASTGFDKDIDAALVKDNDVYLFKGDRFVKAPVGSSYIDEGYPMFISEVWSGVYSSGIDAAFCRGDKIYFFKGSEYIRYDWNSKKVDANYPMSIAAQWKGVFSSDIDAALITEDNRVYFFKGGEYTRYDWSTGVESGYPSSTPEYWSGISANKISAAFYEKKTYPRGVAFLMQGQDCRVFDWDKNKVDEDQSLSIALKWQFQMPVKNIYIKEFRFTYIPPCKMSDARDIDLSCDISISSTPDGTPTKIGTLIASTGPAGSKGDNRVDSAPFFYVQGGDGLDLGSFGESQPIYVSYKIYERGKPNGKTFEGKDSINHPGGTSNIQSNCIKTIYDLDKK